VLALGFRPEPFATVFPDGRVGGLPDVHVHYAVEPEPLDTGGAIAFAARHVGAEGTFVVANGDIVTDLDVGRLVAEHRRIGRSATLHLTPVVDPSAFGVVETDGAIVRRFIEKPSPGETDSNLVNAGTYVFEPSVLDRIEPGRPISIERVTFPELAARRELAAVPTDDYWIDAGRPELYLQANLDLVNGVRGRADDAVHPEAVVDPTASIDGSVVGPSARVGPGATIRGSLLLPGAVVGSGTVVVGSIVGGRVGSGARIERCVVGGEHAVPGGATACDERLPEPG
jgi:mannose-1-phosphate guanylyltransferase